MISTLQTKEKIRKLKENGNWSKDSIELFNVWEKELTEFETEDELLNNPRIVKLCDMLEAQVVAANGNLTTIRTLTNEQRSYLYAVKDIAGIVLSAFKRQAEQKVGAIEKEVEEGLKRFNIND